MAKTKNELDDILAKQADALLESAGYDDLMIEAPKKSKKRTEEDAEKGIENVKNVYQELEKLLAPRDIQKIKDAKNAEPYYKIIQGKEDPNTEKA